MPDREKVIEALRLCRENFSTKSCRKCPYIRGRDGTGTCYPIDAIENGMHLCWQDLVDDALALLKEQEARVMTLEEVETSKGFVWVEFHSINENKLSLEYVNVRTIESFRDSFVLSTDSGIQWLRERGDYNRGIWFGMNSGWRCWTARPTPEQMRDTKWEDSDAE